MKESQEVYDDLTSQVCGCLPQRVRGCFRVMAPSQDLLTSYRIPSESLHAHPLAVYAAQVSNVIV